MFPSPILLVLYSPSWRIERLSIPLHCISGIVLPRTYRRCCDNQKRASSSDPSLLPISSLSIFSLPTPSSSFCASDKKASGHLSLPPKAIISFFWLSLFLFVDFFLTKTPKKFLKCQLFLLFFFCSLFESLELELESTQNGQGYQVLRPSRGKRILFIV